MFNYACSLDAYKTEQIPSNLSYDEASTIPVAVSTAWIGLYHALPSGFGLDAPISAAAKGKYKDTPLVVLGGATSVGQVGAYWHVLCSLTRSSPPQFSSWQDTPDSPPS